VTRRALRGPGPLWRKTPYVLLRYPVVLGAVTGSALLLALAGSSGPLFLSVSEASALRHAIEASNRYEAGLFVSATVRYYVRDEAGRRRPGTARPTAALRRASGGLDHLGPLETAVVADEVDLGAARRGRTRPARLFARTGALQHIQVVRRSSDGRGLWIADSTARELHLAAGERLLVTGRNGRRAATRVAGTYRALSSLPPTPYWGPLFAQVYPRCSDCRPPPSFVIADRHTILDLATRLGGKTAGLRWMAPIRLHDRMTVPEAESLARRISLLGRSMVGGRLSASFSCRCGISGTTQVSSSLRNDLERAAATAAGLRAPVEMMAAAGIAMALTIMLGAGFFAMSKRRVEARLLHARGVSPAVIGTKLALESLVPCALGATLGLALGFGVVDRLVPATPVGPDARVDAAYVMSVALPVALVLIASAAASSVRRENGGGPRLLPWRGSVPWEIPLLLLAALAFVALARAPGDDTAPGTSLYLLLFPALAIGGLSGLGGRGFKRALGVLRARTRRASPSLYLALRRLSGAKRLAMLLVALAGLAVGILSYASALTASVDETSATKASLFVGSDVSVPVDRSYRLPRSFPFPHARVTDLAGAATLSDHRVVDIAAVEPRGAPGVLTWDERFADRPLGALLRSIDRPRSHGVDALATEDIGTDVTITLHSVSIPIHVVHVVDAFPGMTLGHPLIVVEPEAFEAAAERAGTSNPLSAVGTFPRLLFEGPPGAVRAALRRLGFSDDESLSQADVLDQPSFVSVTRSLDFMRILGIAATLLAVVALALYLQARSKARALSYDLSRRMGLRPAAHVGAVVLELGAMLALAVVMGFVLGALCALAVYPLIDPLPDIPPPPLYEAPTPVALPLVAGLVVVTAVGALQAHRLAARTDIAETLRA
jgi:putative ABC transport system permease protein